MKNYFSTHQWKDEVLKQVQLASGFLKKCQSLCLLLTAILTYIVAMPDSGEPKQLV